MLLLYEDPRMPLQLLAKKIGISRQAVNHRIQSLAKLGLFKSIRSEISLSYLDGVVVWIWGRPSAAKLDKVLDRLGESEFTFRVTVAGGNQILVWAFLRKMAELSGYVRFVKEVAEMPEMTVGLPCFWDGINEAVCDGPQPKDTHRKLSPLDLRIIATLQDDARKPASEIGARIGVSTKTVRRHIELMRKDGSLDYNAPWDIPPGQDMITIVLVSLKGSANTIRSARRLLRLDPLHFMYLRQFSNIPNLLLGLITSDRMSEIRKILKYIQEDQDVLSVTPNLMYYERNYSSWDNELVHQASDPVH